MTCVLVAGLVPALGHLGLASGDVPVRRFEITAARFRFEPAQIEVRAGDVVELVLRSADTDHGIAIKALGIKAGIPKGGAAVSVSFVAGRPGRFEFQCSEYCGSGHKRMKGELVVAEAK